MIVYTLHMFSGRIFFHLDYKWQNCFQAELRLIGNIASKGLPPPPMVLRLIPATAAVYPPQGWSGIKWCYLVSLG